MLEAIGLFLLLLVASLVLVGAVIVLLPAEYFVASRPFLAGYSTPVRAIGITLKNLLGLGLVGLGIVLSIPGVPGQGLLTILLGLLLLDVPYKRRLMGLLLRRRHLLATLNSLRKRFGRQPLIFDEQRAI